MGPGHTAAKRLHGVQGGRVVESLRPNQIILENLVT